MQQRSKSKWLQKAFVFLLAITIVATYSLPQSFGVFGAQTAKAASLPTGAQNDHGITWQITSDGTLELGKAEETENLFIGNTLEIDKSKWAWDEYRSQIKKIKFMGNVNAKGSLSRMFFEMVNLSDVENLSKLNAEEVTSLHAMFARCKALRTFDFNIKTTEKLKSVLHVFLETEKIQELTIGDDVDFSGVEDAGGLFQGMSSLKELNVDFSKSKLNLGNVKNASYMFSGCKSLTELDVSDIETQNLENAQGMFNEMYKLTTLKLKKEDGSTKFTTPKLVNMYRMFYGCRSLTELDITSMKPDGLQVISCAFVGCSRLKSLDVSNFDTSRIINESSPGVWHNGMQLLFKGCTDLQEIKGLENFKTGHIENFHEMFMNCASLEKINLTNFDTSSALRFTAMFSGCRALTELDVSGFKTSNIINTTGMFFGCEAITELDISGFETPELIRAGQMFANCFSLKEIKGLTTATKNGKFTTDKVVDMGEMFMSCNALEELDVSNFNTENVMNMRGMFAHCFVLPEIKGVEDFETGKVGTGQKSDDLINSETGSMEGMFRNCKAITSFDLTRNGWDTANVPNMNRMFMGCDNLQSIDITGWNTGNVELMTQMFSTNPELTEIKGLADLDTSSATAMYGVFSDTPKLILPEDSIRNWDVSSVGTGGATSDEGDMRNMFQNNGTEKLDITGWDTSNVKSMANMFHNNLNLTEIKGIKDIDTGSVTNMANMFLNCPKLKLPEDLTGWDVSKVGTGGIYGDQGSTAGMFNGTATEKLDIAGWDISNVKDMNRMFQNNPNLETIKGLEDLDTSNVTEMEKVFNNCLKLKSLDINSWDVSKVGTGGIDANQGTMIYMFGSCKALKELDLSGWNTSNVRSMYGMFFGTNLETIDVTPLDTSSVVSMGLMFAENQNLTEIKGLENLDTSKVAYMENMFRNCPNLKDTDALFVEMTVSAEETNTHIMYENSSALVKATEDMLDKANLAKYTPATQALINTAIDDVKDAVWNGREFTREKLKKMQDDIRAAAGQIVDDSYQDARDAFRDTIEGKEQKEADTAATKADSGIDTAQGSLNDAKAKAPQGGQPAIDAVKKAQTDAGKAVDDAKASKAAADEALKKAEERAATMQRALDLAKAVGDQSKIDRAQRLKDDADQDLKDAQAAAEASEKAAEKAIEDAEKIKQEADKLAAEILADEAAKQADAAKKEADAAKKKAEEAKTSGDAQKAKDDAQKAKADADKAAKTAKDAQDAAKDALDGAKDDLNKAKDELLAAEEELEKATKDLEDAIDSGNPGDIREARAKLEEAKDKVDALKEKEKAAEDNVKECEEIAKKADDAAKKAAEAQKAAEDALKAADGALDKLKAKEELDKLLADAAKVDQSKYTPDTAKKFNDAINAGKKTSANPSSTPQQLNAAKDALNSAWRGLMPKDLDEARKNLDSKIGTAEKINQDIYTPATAKKLQDAILSGKKVLANPSATVAQINAASKAVDDAVAGLKKKPDSNKPVNLLTTSPVGKTVSALDSSLAKLKSDNDIKGSAFGLLKARGQAKGKNGLKLNWSKVKGASKYIVYGNKCGKYNSYKKLKTTKAKSFSPKKILKAKMKKNTYYKMMIVAVDKSNKVVAVSKTIHVATNGGKKGNDKSLKVTSPKNRKLSLKKGAGKKIKVKEVKAKKKKVARHRKVTFESSNPNVATVSSKGKVTAKAKGKATIYAYAQNGVYKTVNVTVK